MSRLKLFISATAIAVSLFVATPDARAQTRNTGAVNISGLYMAAQDSDLYYDFAGFSLKLGFYITDTTELFGEMSFADGLDTSAYLDYTMNMGFMMGITQYIPLSDAASLYVRGKVGLTYNIWAYDTPYYTDGYYYYGYYEDEESDTYFTYAIGAGFSVSLSDTLALEIGYDYMGLDTSNQYRDDPEMQDDWANYHVIHVGLDIEF